MMMIPLCGGDDSGAVQLIGGAVENNIKFLYNQELNLQVVRGGWVI